MGCQTFQEFKACVLKTLAEVPKKVIQNLFKSMKTRVCDCKKKHGDKTKY
jgi:hypothetical protein